MSEWKKANLSEVMNIIGGGTPKRNIAEYWNGTIPWLSVADFNEDRRYVSSSKESITNLGLKNSSTKILKRGSLIISARGTVGCIAQLKADMAFNQSCYGLEGKSGILDNDFLYYLLKNNIKKLKKNTHGAVFDTITKETFEHIEIEYPLLEKQKEISKLLGSFDDKIELNTQTNQTLEQIAQAIFKSWFVDFDPVKAKMDVLAHGGTVEQAELQAMQIISGKTAEELEQMQRTNPEEYKTLEKTTALFPSEMVESKLGDIPKGWEVQQIKDIGFIVCGKTPSKQNPNFYGGDIPFIKIPDMHGNTFITKTNEYLSKEGADSQKTKYLPKGSICVSCIATVGKVSIVTKPSQTNQQINSIIPNNDYLTEFLYFYMNELEDEFYSLASGGSATLNMNTRVFSSIKLLKPKDDLLTIYHSKVKPIFDMILSNQKENKNLAEIRDMLLPKLLSGDISFDI
ncbi:type I restriction enzyme S subunit [Bisgaardia hudsonensis]|uniref:Type I restriction enzyme S subunit n=1 Tax=Bisgaardia hudsonensis TaxID=109472 RepID=A0A4R2N0U0_9PAST|nr:restriction endonuclease subunit S [Bisgaardia hudsonensis]QLB13280.1 hypothetical protein A6A11_06450 [Bisgaardia hudsonensis]TCP13139.1 type I restriction enzyme S subunit [Bisgaardia hudsonensis]